MNNHCKEKEAKENENVTSVFDKNHNFKYSCVFLPFENIFLGLFKFFNFSQENTKKSVFVLKDNHLNIF